MFPRFSVSALLLGVALLAPLAARADDGPRRRPRIELHVHTDACRHGPPPGAPHQEPGRYELQTVERWVPGYYEQVWVPEVCHHKHKRRHHHTVCRGGYHEKHWVEGRYERVEEWVWVPAPHRHRPHVHVSASF